MTAPLPLRFYNPVKELCQKVNLDYETVIGTGVSPSLREAYLNADIPKSISEYNSKDRQAIKHKMEFLNRKYGTQSESNNGTGESKDKGIERYNHGLTVEPVCTDDSGSDKSTAESNGVEDTFKRKVGERRSVVWVPGKGVIHRT